MGCACLLFVSSDPTEERYNYKLLVSYNDIFILTTGTWTIIHTMTWVAIRGIHSLDFLRKTTNAVLSDLQIVDAIK